MRAKDESNLRRAWYLLSAAAFILPLWLGLPFATAGNSGNVTASMLFSMICLSFPSSIIYIVFLAEFFPHTAPGYTPLSYLFFWLLAFAVGYFQWCWLIPRLFKRQKMITLGLVQKGEVAVESFQQEETKTLRVEALRAELPARSSASPVRHFDELGRTPFERAVCDD
jgi:hypothetical protein